MEMIATLVELAAIASELAALMGGGFVVIAVVAIILAAL